MRSKRYTPKAIAISLSPRERARVRVFGTTLLLATALIVVVLVAIASAQDSTTTDDTDTRDHLANLSTTEKEELRRKRDQFQQLDDVEKKRLRELHSTIASSPDRDRLEATMLQYHEWLKTLPGKERSELLKMPPEQKIAEIKRLMQEQRSQQFRKLVATPPEPNDVRAIFTWFDSYVEAHEAELLAMLPEQTQGRLKQVNIAGMRRKMLVMALHQNNNNDAEPNFPPPTPDDLAKLNERLSVQAKETLAKATNPDEKLKLVQGWLRAAMMSRMLPPQVSDERLMAYYRENRDRLQKEDAAKVDELETLPPEAFYQEVRNIYFRERGPDRWRGHWREGEDHPPGEWRGGRGDGRRDGEHGRDDRDGRGPGGNGPRRQRPNDGQNNGGGRPDRPQDEPRDGFHPPPPGDPLNPPQGEDLPIGPSPEETP